MHPGTRPARILGSRVPASEARRRAAFAEFLRSRRERQRTPGLRHPRPGTLRFEIQSFTSAPFELRLVVFVPDARTAARLAVTPRP